MSKLLINSVNKLKLTHFFTGIILVLLTLPATALANKGIDEMPLHELIKSIDDKLTPSNDLPPKSSTTEANSEGQNNTPSPLGLISRISVGEELFFTTIIDKILLGDTFAIKSSTGIKIGLVSLIEVLDFPIESNLDDVTANGWFISASNSFLLKQNSNALTVNINKKEFVINSDKYEILHDDIYIESSEISKWFNIFFDINYQELEIKVTSPVLLPIQEQLARQTKNIKSYELNPIATLPWKESPFQLISDPLIDVQLNSTSSNKHSSSGYSIVGGHDLAYYNADYFISGNNDELLNRATITLSKTSTTGDLLGFINATEYSFGDVTPVKTGLSETRSQSRGLTFSNSPIDKIVDNDEVSLTGTIQVGWDVELYRNGTLIDQRLNVINGRYEFNDIELFYGQNKLELIFYGKQGQVNREVKDIYVNGNAVEKGEIFYSASITQTDKSVFGVNDVFDTGAGMLLSSAVTAGISKNFSINLSQSYQSFDDRDDYATYGIASDFTVLDSLLLRVALDKSNQNDSHYQLTARTEFFEQAINTSLSKKQGLAIVEDDNDNPFLIKTEENAATITMSGLLFSEGSVWLNYQNSWSYNQALSGIKNQQFRNSLSLGSPIININNQINWINTEYVNSYEQLLNDNLVNGSIRLQRSFGRVFFRFTSSYNLEPIKEFTQHAASLNLALASSVQSEIEFKYQPLSERWSSSLGINWRRDEFNFQTDLQRNNEDDWRLAFFINFSFGYQRDINKFHFSNRSLSNYGALAVRVFEDENVNGLFDEGEMLIDGAKVIGVQNRKRSTTDESGVAVLASMPNHKTTDIILDRESLPDPFLIPTTSGISITPRAGYIGRLDFPVVISGEIDGTIYIRTSNGEEKIASYATVFLLDEEDKIVATTRTEFDGYYLFTDLVPGNYHISIDKKYIKRAKLRDPEKVELVLAEAGVILNGSDLILSELEFHKGFAVLSKSFTSLKVLKAYWFLVRKQFNNQFKAKAFYFQNESDGKYQLYLGFYQEEIEAITACTELTAEKINCRVEPFEFNQ